ncbi:hypothetical protein GGI21_000860 [Coemansia aciculifera]|nr:hypothetical protein GGI21_000860 [Coemansia aciculifera]
MRALLRLHGSLVRRSGEFTSVECRHKHTDIVESEQQLGEAARAEIEGKLATLKVDQLNDIMRSCGLAQGTGKAHKLSALSSFIWSSQRLALGRCRSQNRQVLLSLGNVHGEVVPEEVVSIDIGFRNLAFAHVARCGKVLDWRRVELLTEANFEPWTLAAVVEELVQRTLPVRPASTCTYLIEHQRFRSQGSAAVTDSVMVNNLIEALLHANLRHAGAHIVAINPMQVSAHWGLIEGRGSSSAELQQPNAVEPLGIERSKGRGKRSEAGRDEHVAELIARMDEVLHEQKQLTSTQRALIQAALGQDVRRKRATKVALSRDLDELAQRGSKSLGTLRESRRRQIKKERTISIVQSWILNSLAGRLDTHLLESPSSSSALPLGPDWHMSFPAAMAEMFSSEKKKDDLCDCITQGVAWYSWQQRVVDVLERYGSAQILATKL